MKETFNIVLTHKMKNEYEKEQTEGKLKKGCVNYQRIIENSNQNALLKYSRGKIFGYDWRANHT